jgi:hypothetical protein
VGTLEEFKCADNLSMNEKTVNFNIRFTVPFLKNTHLGVEPHAHQAKNKIIPQTEKKTLFFL